MYLSANSRCGVAAKAAKNVVCSCRAYAERAEKAEAVAMLEDLVATSRQVFGESHPFSISARDNLNRAQYSLKVAMLSWELYPDGEPVEKPSLADLTAALERAGLDIDEVGGMEMLEGYYGLRV